MSPNLVNEVVPGTQVLESAAELARSMRGANPDIISIGRGLYYATRCAAPDDAGQKARSALLAALKVLHESGRD